MACVENLLSTLKMSAPSDAVVIVFLTPIVEWHFTELKWHFFEIKWHFTIVKCHSTDEACFMYDFNKYKKRVSPVLLRQVLRSVALQVGNKFVY